MTIVTKAVREETFSFTPEGEPPIHIRSGALRDWLRANAMHRIVNLDFPVQPLEELVVQHGLEEPRMRSMTLLEAGDPVIVDICEDGTNILIDGGHRRWFWAAQGVHRLRGWAVPHSVWSQFLFDPNGPGVIQHFADGSMLPQRQS